MNESRVAFFNLFKRFAFDKVDRPFLDQIDLTRKLRIVSAPREILFITNVGALARKKRDPERVGQRCEQLRLFFFRRTRVLTEVV